MIADQNYKFLEGGGEMGELIRTYDWDSSLLGPIDTWPYELRSVLRMILDTPFPMYVAWGPEHIQFYNNDYRPILGTTKHPHALGNSSKETFLEIWDIIGPMFNDVMKGTPIGFPNLMLPLDRNGFIEECYFDFSYSPIKDEHNNVAGILVTVIETTERLNQAKQIKDSADELKFAIEAAELCTWSWDIKDKFISGNERLMDWFGLNADDKISLKSTFNLIKKQDRNKVMSTVKKALKPSSGGSFDIIYKILNVHTGADRIVRAKGRAIFKNEEILYRFSGTLQDITSESFVRQALENSENNFRNLVMHAPVAMCVFDGPNYVVKIANERVLELWGKSIEDVINKPIFEGLPEVKEQGIEELLNNVYTTGERFVAKERSVNLPRNGKIELTYINFVYEALQNEFGITNGIAAVAIEVTEQVLARKKIEEAEERARLAINAAKVGTFDYFPKTGNVITSSRFDAIFGFEKQMLHGDYVNAFVEEDNRIRKQAHDLAFKTGRLSYQARIKSPDNGIRWIESEGEVYYDNLGNPERILGTMLDITENKFLQQQKDDFIAIASHELKTPLTTLNASLQFLSRKAKQNGEENHLLNKADKSLSRLTSLVNDLLNVTKINNGQLPIHKSKFACIDLITECTEQYIINNQYDFEFLGDLNAEIIGDFNRLEQVLTNLISNAIKYAPQSKEIKIRVDKIKKGTKISVIDFGPGIPAEKQERLFNRYYQADNSPVQFSGLGLGLYISSEIIKKHDGQMGVESEMGMGSKFWFSIPDGFIN